MLNSAFSPQGLLVIVLLRCSIRSSICYFSFRFSYGLLHIFSLQIYFLQPPPLFFAYIYDLSEFLVRQIVSLKVQKGYVTIYQYGKDIEAKSYFKQQWNNLFNSLFCIF